MNVHTEDVSIKSATQTQINRALQATYNRAKAKGPGTAKASLDLAKDRYVIFSDLHKGARNRADDFWRSERAYNAAIAYYYQMGHTLILLGDVEELWEEKPKAVLQAYERTSQLEAQFHQEGRYYRILGNHDDEWQFESRVNDLLAPKYRPPEFTVYESLLLTVVDGNSEPLGSLFLIHGHQGTTESDRWAGFSKHIVRHLWRPIQRLTHWSLNTPATSWQRIHQHNRMLYTWAESQTKFVLIAGHTHRPVFKSVSHEAKLQEELARRQEEAGNTPSLKQLEKIAELLAEIEWVVAQQKQKPLSSDKGKAPTKPCYFNTGCCCYLDGDITGLEIADGEIRLVRWPDDDKAPRRKILDRALLADILARC
jgi:UDP-2,3-diacylglucosamine pyrophosphatase LpxH